MMTSMRVRYLPLLIACTVLSPSGFALAANAPQGANLTARETGPTHVIGFVAGDHFDEAETLTRAVKKTIELSTSQRLGSGDFSLEVLTAALGCPERPERACLKRIASKIASQRFLWGTINVEGQSIEAELHLYAEDSGDKKVKFSYPASIKDSTNGELLGIVANAVSQLLGPLRYRVAVHSNEQTGAVMVDGKEAGQLVDGEATLELANGDHQFRLKPASSVDEKSSNGKGDADKSSAEQTVRVRVAELTKVRFEQSGADKAKAGEGKSPAVESREQAAKPMESSRPAEAFAESKSRSSNTQRTWGYITLGAGVALVAGGAVAAASLYTLNRKSSFQRYRDGLSPDEDACTEARHNYVVPGAMTPAGVRDLCRSASTLEVAEIVLIASGVVAAGTGLTLLLTSKSQTPPAAKTIEPRVVVGRGRTDIGVAVHF
jgi:hypothetical protein